MTYGEFKINLAAGLKDSMVEILKPLWNDPQYNLSTTPKPHTFIFTVQNTYYNTGFFNVSVHESMLFHKVHNTKIKIFLPNQIEPIIGHINRTANNNGTPRIMGGKPLRQWFQKTPEAMYKVEVEVRDPKEIHLNKHTPNHTLVPPKTPKKKLPSLNISKLRQQSLGTL
jgi:hypothetical protein